MIQRHDSQTRLSLWLVAGPIGLCFILQGGAQDSRPTASEFLQPNIILILADDLGYGDLGCYGQQRIRTPNLDRMAAEGMRFTDFYAGSTVCTPSRAALMLGQHTGHLRLRGNVHRGTLLPEELTVSEVLKRAGYRTALFGKWGLADDGQPGVPQKKGFDHFLGYLENIHAHDYYPEFLWRVDANCGFDGKHALRNSGSSRLDYVPDLCTRAALSFVGANQPFFLFLSFTIPHANNEEGRRSGNGMQVPDDAPYAKEPWPQTEKNKAAMITRMDADIGKVLARLKELKVDDRTLVVFTSDNGPHQEGGVDPKFHNSSGPLRGIKRDLTEGGIRVPLIACWPGTIKAGQVSKFLAANWDLMPTFAELAGAPVPQGLDGISLLPLLKGGRQTNRHEFLYWEFHERGAQQAVRMGDWKAIRQQVGAALALFNLRLDPAESMDVAAKHPEIVAILEDYLKTARTESTRWPLRARPVQGKQPSTPNGA